MRHLWHQVLSQRGGVSQTVLAGRILQQYKSMDSAQQLSFFKMLASEFAFDNKVIKILEDNHERFVQTGKLRVTGFLLREYRAISELWSGHAGNWRKRPASATVVKNVVSNLDYDTR